MQKLRLLLTWCIVAVMGVWFVGGMVRFPDSPIHPCATGFCGKQGQPHTENDYRLHGIWSRVLLIGWPTGMLALALLNWRDMVKSKNGKI